MAVKRSDDLIPTAGRHKYLRDTSSCHRQRHRSPALPVHRYPLPNTPEPSSLVLINHGGGGESPAIHPAVKSPVALTLHPALRDVDSVVIDYLRPANPET